MGFMDLTVSGSDTAADCFHTLTDKVAELLEKELKDEGNEYNTPGWLNVAMIFDESIIDAFPGKTGCCVGEKLEEVATKIVKIIEAFQKSKEGHWEKKELTRLKVRLQKWIQQHN